MPDPRDAAIQAELDFARLLLATAKTPRERREAWNMICALEEECDVHRDLQRGAGGSGDSR